MNNKLIIIVILFLTASFNSTHAQITPWEAIAKMQKGINLGNTLEAPKEGQWNNPNAEEYYFDLYKEAGFEVVRIPVRWDNYTSNSSPYNITKSWLDRVEEIVDWGLARDLFIVINSHHDNWIKDDYATESTRIRFDSIWSQIATRFKDKSEKLVFEVLNEPHGLSRGQNIDMHKRITSIIRKTNPTRLVIFQGHNWGGSDELIDTYIPDDEYVIGSFHSYDPYRFGLLGEGTWGSPSDINALKNKFLSVKNWSDENNIPVFLGEFGSLRTCDYNSRMKHYKHYVHFSREYGFSACAWDDGGNFRVMERSDSIWDEVKDILIYTSPESPDNPRLEVLQDSMIKISWINKTTLNDSIFIQRRKWEDLNYKTIAVIDRDSSSYLDIKPETKFIYHYRIIAHFNDSTDLYSNPVRIYFPDYVVPTQELFLDEPATIPGVVEAENFDKGGEGVSYHDSDKSNDGKTYRPNEAVDIFEANGNYLIFNAKQGEWYEYTVNVEQERTYDIEVNVASIIDGGKFLIKIGNVESDTIETISSGSWVNSTPVNTSLKLLAGEQIMRFTIVGSSSFNIDNIIFSFQTGIDKLSGNNIEPLIIYQSPDKLVIQNKGTDPLKQINVFNITGSLLRSIDSPAPTTEIEVSEFYSGIYIIQAITDIKKYSKKIIIR